MTITRMALMAWMAGMVTQTGHAQQTQTVYLRNRPNVHPEVLLPAKVLASKMFAKIGISLEWGKGEPAVESSQAAVFIELVTGTPENRSPGAPWRMPCPTRALTSQCSSTALKRSTIPLRYWRMSWSTRSLTFWKASAGIRTPGS